MVVVVVVTVMMMVMMMVIIMMMMKMMMMMMMMMMMRRRRRRRRRACKQKGWPGGGCFRGPRKPSSGLLASYLQAPHCHWVNLKPGRGPVDGGRMSAAEGPIRVSGCGCSCACMARTTSPGANDPGR